MDGTAGPMTEGESVLAELFAKCRAVEFRSVPPDVWIPVLRVDPGGCWSFWIFCVNVYVSVWDHFKPRFLGNHLSAEIQFGTFSDGQLVSTVPRVGDDCLAAVMVSVIGAEEGLLAFTPVDGYDVQLGNILNLLGEGDPYRPLVSACSYGGHSAIILMVGDVNGLGECPGFFSFPGVGWSIPSFLVHSIGARRLGDAVSMEEWEFLCTDGPFGDHDSGGDLEGPAPVEVHPDFFNPGTPPAAASSPIPFGREGESVGVSLPSVYY